MTPEMNKTEEIPDGADLDATRRISAGAAEQAEAPEPEEAKRLSARFETHICVPGTGARGASRKSRVGPRRA